MAINKRRSNKRLLSKISFEEIDHRLSCGWHVDLQENNSIKKRLRTISNVNNKELDEKYEVKNKS